MSPEPSQSTRLGSAADALAMAVADLLPAGYDVALIDRFRAALSNLLAETIGGATVMAAGAVVALDAKVEKLSRARIKQLHDIQSDVDRLAMRIHSMEDSYLDDGVIGRLTNAVHAVAIEVEQLKARAIGDGE